MTTITIKDPVSNNNVSVHVNSSTEIDGGMYYDVDYTARTAAEVDCRFAVIDYYDGNMVCQNDWQDAFVDIDEIEDAHWADCTPTEEIDVAEAAELLDVSRQRVHQLIQSGQLEGRKIGKTWYVYKSSVEERLAR